MHLGAVILFYNARRKNEA